MQSTVIVPAFSLRANIYIVPKNKKKTGGPVGGRPFLLSANSQWLIAKGLDYFITLVVVVVPSV